MADINIDIDIKNNKAAYEKALEECAERILTMIGMECETAAKLLAPVDTGLLRNSITYALAGEKAAQETYSGDNGGSGKYSGTAPPDKPHIHSVHLGTNVEYAMVQELGRYNHKKGFSPFLRPAVNDNINTFKKIILSELKAAMNDDQNS